MFPDDRSLTEASHQEDLHAAAALLLGPEEARRHHARVVDDEQRAGRDPRVEVDDGAVLERVVRGVEHEQAGTVARRGGVRGDALGREVKVEQLAPHAARSDGW